MTEFSRHCRMPIERAIEVVEDVFDHSDVVLRAELVDAVKSDAPEATPILDHTIQVMIKGGYVRRVHLGHDRLAYEKTDRWSERDETLVFIKAPVYKKRFRPRSQAYRMAIAAGADKTVAAQLVSLSKLPAQRDLFGSDQ